MKTSEESGQAKNTIDVFTADDGPEIMLMLATSSVATGHRIAELPDDGSEDSFATS